MVQPPSCTDVTKLGAQSRWCTSGEAKKNYISEYCRGYALVPVLFQTGVDCMGYVGAVHGLACIALPLVPLLRPGLLRTAYVDGHSNRMAVGAAGSRKSLS